MASPKNPDELLAAVQQHAAGKLTNTAVLRTMFAQIHTTEDEAALNDLAFHAKFCYNTHGIMKRIGPGGDGYDKLSAEFASRLAHCKSLLLRIYSTNNTAEREAFEREFLAMTPDALSRLMTLLHDLSWYKNYLIDTR